VFLGWFYSFVGQWDQAIGHFRNTLEFDPGFIYAHWYLGLALIEKGMNDDGIQIVENVVQHLGESPMLAYAKAGRVQKARDLLRDREADDRKLYIPATFARVYFALGEIDKGFDWMEKAVDEYDQQIYYIHADKSFDPLRSHPRYQALLRKMNLAP
jgi:tetratricopeptide (TPR) repeat protein